MTSIASRVKIEPYCDYFFDKRLLPKTLSEIDIYFEKLMEAFPKLKFWEWTTRQIEDYVEKFLQVHSLRCRKCLSERFERCPKTEILINIVEIF